MSRTTCAGFFGLLALAVWWMTNLRIGAKPRSRVRIDSSAPHSARVTIVGAEIPGAGVDRFLVVGPAAGRADGASDGEGRLQLVLAELRGLERRGDRVGEGVGQQGGERHRRHPADPGPAEEGPAVDGGCGVGSRGRW